MHVVMLSALPDTTSCLADEQQLEHPIPKGADSGALSAAEAPSGIPCSAFQRTFVDLKVKCVIRGECLFICCFVVQQL